MGNDKETVHYDLEGWRTGDITKPGEKPLKHPVITLTLGLSPILVGVAFSRETAIKLRNNLTTLIDWLGQPEEEAIYNKAVEEICSRCDNAREITIDKIGSDPCGTQIPCPKCQGSKK